ncbi:MAG: glycolate oxidase subunit GlcF [Alphaproteobacteria bacterium]|nr:glycolate oxidase subunit GlcF [Alphaproteobacteria bacterium]HPF46100.1 glycolate oxidase subunit GlcF [Emcibacteraceae bacterium]HRW29607.1 glycolate oxidase subunit GlcF [Emcibacteraceae bacterium]
MQTRFSQKQLEDPKTAEAEKILRNCVHCGFCMATCPTYLLLGNELDGPRGRIYLIKEMLENDAPATKVEVEHLDKCLTCLSCTTTCPSGVDYAHLLAHGRSHIEKTYKRPLTERLFRGMLSTILPYPNRFKLAIRASGFISPFKSFLPDKLRAMLDLRPPLSHERAPQITKAREKTKYRMGLSAGCVQRAVGEHINLATLEFLSNHNVDVVMPPAVGCCGALDEHMGKSENAIKTAKRYIDGWMAEIEKGPLDAIVINTSGCGTSIKDYGHLFRHDPVYAEKAKKVATLAKDISEVITMIGLGETKIKNTIHVAYHSACSLNHGQKIGDLPALLLKEAGFKVSHIKESHICCGSAGTYNITQPEIATELRSRKIKNIEATKADVVASSNLGCNIHLASGTDIPVLHVIELLNWATGGKKPEAIKIKKM